MIFGSASAASPQIDYVYPNIVVPDGEICKPDEVIGALSSLFLVAPVDLTVRGLDDRLPPLQLDDVGNFGMTRLGSDGQPRFHAGTDLIADEGEAVVAVLDGEAATVGTSSTLGNYIILRGTVAIPPVRPCAVDFLYAHLSTVTVTAGQDVTMGQSIGAVGRSGNLESNIPTHLHIEFWVRPYLGGADVRQQWTRDFIKLLAF